MNGRFAKVNNTSLYLEESGAGPAITFLHGFTLDLHMWDDQFSEFARTRRAIRYDKRGFGRSALPASESYAHWRDLEGLLDHLGAERAILIGLSQGGEHAIDFALSRPDRAAALVLADAVAGGARWSDEFRESMKRVMARAASGDLAGAKQDWLRQPLFEPALEKPAVAARLRQMMDDYSGFHFHSRDPAERLTPHAVERLAEIQVPTLVVVGERDTAEFQRFSETLAAGIRNAKKIALPGAGHLSNMESPAEFNQAVMEFLDASVS